MSHIDDTSQLTRKLLLYMDLGLANNEIQLIVSVYVFFLAPSL